MTKPRGFILSMLLVTVPTRLLHEVKNSKQKKDRKNKTQQRACTKFCGSTQTAKLLKEASKRESWRENEQSKQAPEHRCRSHRWHRFANECQRELIGDTGMLVLAALHLPAI